MRQRARRKGTPLLYLVVMISFVVTSCSLILPAFTYPQHSMPSHGTVAYSGFTLKVSGSRIVDGLNREVMLKGFHLWSGNVFHYDWGRMELTVERFRQIKDWGFNLVFSSGWWGDIFEPYQDQDGVYDEKNLAKLEQVIQRAQEAGLYFIISIRVSFNDVNPPTWQGWGRHSYLLQEEYLNRYCRLWEMLVQRFKKYDNLIGYCPWHFPWHQTVITDLERAQYYSVIIPRLTESIRKYSDKILFVSSMRCQSDELPAEPLADRNVVYIHEDYKPYSVSHEGEAWNYDIDYLRRYKEPAVDFANKYNVPVMVEENGLDWHKYPKDQSRLDWLDTQLSLFDELGYVGWLNWIYTMPDGGGFAVLNEDGTPTEVVDVLRQHNSI